MSNRSDWLTITMGSAPLIISLPHTGSHIPDEYAVNLQSRWLALTDTDWWIDRLYNFAQKCDATVVHTAISRTVIDVNRDPDDVSFYPGQITTSLCPLETFDGEPLYRPGQTPSGTDINYRKAQYYAPYHQAITDQIERLQKQHQQIVLYDCHSIRSLIPRLFTGLLPELNIGTNNGKSCSDKLAQSMTALCQASSFTTVLNGRFKGGYITRHFGKPQQGVHAIQIELACRSYMREPTEPVNAGNYPPQYDVEKASLMQSHLRVLLENCLSFAHKNIGYV